MKLKKEFIVHESGDETMLVSTGVTSFSGLVKGNKTAGLMIEMLKNDVTEEDIIAALRTKFEAPEGVIERDVAKVVDELRKIGAIDE